MGKLEKLKNEMYKLSFDEGNLIEEDRIEAAKVYALLVIAEKLDKKE